MKKVTIKQYEHAEVEAPKEPMGFLHIPLGYHLIRAEGESLEVSDGYHTMDELYEFRKMYNAALFNTLYLEDKQGEFRIHKSWKHSDGELCFGGDWFIVVAYTPKGQISNHYEAKDWDLFRIPEEEKADKWDGHTSTDVLERLKSL